MAKREAVVCKDFYGKELFVGDKVIFVYKEYGYRKISEATLRAGIITKLPTKEIDEEAYWFQIVVQDNAGNKKRITYLVNTNSQYIIKI